MIFFVIIQIRLSGGIMTKKIVVVDDCRLSLAVARDILEAEGYTVQTAENGIDANPLIFSYPAPDLLLMDVEMPLLNGDRKVQLLKQRSRSNEIPIVMISSKTEDELAGIARAAGADGYLCKPLHRDILLAKVRSLVD